MPSHGGLGLEHVDAIVIAMLVYRAAVLIQQEQCTHFIALVDAYSASTAISLHRSPRHCPRGATPGAEPR